MGFSTITPILNTGGFLILIFFLFSCEGSRCGEGIVKDSSSNQPIDSVFCKVTNGNNSMYTDSIGKFNLCGDFGGCMPCKDITIEFSKKGYISQETTNPDNTIILLKKIK